MAADSKNEVLKKPELPDVQTLERVVKKHHERREYLRILRSTVASLLVVAAAAVIISMLFLPVLRVTGTSMTPTLPSFLVKIVHKLKITVENKVDTNEDTNESEE